MIRLIYLDMFFLSMFFGFFRGVSVFSIPFSGFRPFRVGASHQFLPPNFFIFSCDEFYIQVSQYFNANGRSALFLGWSAGGRFHSRTLLRLTSLTSLVQPWGFFSAIVWLRCYVFKCQNIYSPPSAARISEFVQDITIYGHIDNTCSTHARAEPHVPIVPE